MRVKIALSPEKVLPQSVSKSLLAFVHRAHEPAALEARLGWRLRAAQAQSQITVEAPSQPVSTVPILLCRSMSPYPLTPVRLPATGD